MDSVLIVEDESIIRNALRRLLERNKYQVTEAESVLEATQNDLDRFDLIISDLRLPGALGTELISLSERTPVLIMTSYASMRSAVEAMKLGAVDYVAKPFDHEDMIRTVRRVIEQSRETHKSPTLNEPNEAPIHTKENGPRAALGGLVGSCEPMQALYKRLLRVAPADITVLIQGESGTGKELAARAIHQHSERHENPLICVNCAAIPESLIESELFGHEKGAFTGANATREGLIEAAEGGTLFLDEIGELPIEAQARLLRVLQESEVRRVGSVQARTVNVRLVAATHRNLKKLVETGEFREDLYYRLQVIEITLPALRERGSDIIEIAEHLLKKHQQRLHIETVKPLNNEIRHALTQYDWPGNVRELENAIQRALIMADNGEIELADLGIATEQQPTSERLSLSTTPETIADSAEKTPESVSDGESLEEYFQNFVTQHQAALSETELASRLGISRKCLWERRQRFGIPRPKKAAH